MLDKHNRYLSDEKTGIEMLYTGKDISNVEFTKTDDVTRFNKFCNDLGIDRLRILGEDDFDRINTYNIPQHYKEIDVEEYIRGLVPTGVDGTDNAEASQRVDMELALYKERNLFPIIQVLLFVVDILRRNDLVWGVGRGSSVASYILYLIGIHKVDSIKYNLDIREFLKR
jgi:DNA polymerase III alpha subunit